MKSIIRHGIGQGSILAIIVTGISLWLNNINIVIALPIGLSAGIVAAILNGLVIYKFSVPKYVLDEVLVDIDSDEKIIFQAPANYTSRQYPISGKLFLTDKRLIFKNHRQERTLFQLSVALQDIAQVETFKSLKVFENGLAVHTVSNVTSMFIVNKTKHWLNKLIRLKTAHNTGSGK